MHKRIWLKWSAAALNPARALSLIVSLPLAALHRAAAALPYPSRPLTLYVAFAPGGAGDIVARLLAKGLGERLGQPVIIENRPIPVVAVSSVVRARPDGYTLVMAGSGTAVTSALFARLPYDLMTDLAHVSTLASFGLVLVTDGTPAAGRTRFDTVADVLAFARAHPGQLNIATGRLGSTQNLVAELLKAMAGIDAVIVPFRTTADVITAIRSKAVHVAVEMLPPLLTQVHSRSVKALAVTSATRFAGLPAVPTLAEAGVPGFEATSWNGISVPAGTPAAVVHRLSQEIAQAIASPAVLKALQAAGMQVQASTPEQMAWRMRRDIAKWRAVIDKAGIPRQ